MVDIVSYISKELSNPMAADRIAVALIEAGEGLSDFPYANPIYIPIRPLKREYRRLIVGSYILFYWVDEERKEVTIARVIYATRDHERFLK